MNVNILRRLRLLLPLLSSIAQGQANTCDFLETAQQAARNNPAISTVVSGAMARSLELYPLSVFPRSASGNIQAIAESGKLVEATLSNGFHGLRRLTAEQIIKDGVPGSGTNINIAEHVGGAKDSAFCGLAPTPGRGGGGQLTPVEFAREGGVVIEVDGVPGFPTDLHAPRAISQLPRGEAEIATPRRIPTERIKRIGKVTLDSRGREVVLPTDWEPNPNYQPLELGSKLVP